MVRARRAVLQGLKNFPAAAPAPEGRADRLYPDRLAGHGRRGSASVASHSRASRREMSPCLRRQLKM